MSHKVLKLTKNVKRPKSEPGGVNLSFEQRRVQRNAQKPSSPAQHNKNNMHTFGDVSASVPAFLAKLWRLVDDPDTNNLICWTKDGSSFIIQNQAQFARELLPLNYKHNNMASFIRQLNMYGFHKITSIENGGLKFDRDEMEFSHPCFKRNCAYLLEHIKRKISATKNVDEKSAVKQEAVSKVLQDVKAMRGRQDSLDSRFSVMKQENEALWREIASLRQKHAKQQQIVNKLIQFLITIVQPSRNMSGVKRHMQLMIHDRPADGKHRKTSETESDGGGPVIHELSEELLDEVADTMGEFMNPTSPYEQRNASGSYDNECVSPQPVDRPRSSFSASSQNHDYSNQSAEDLFNVVVGSASPAASTASGVNTGVSAQQLNEPSNASPVQLSYHVTEVPDAQPANTTQNVCADETNVLTTPLVREQEERSRLLKERNRLREKVFAYENITAGKRSRTATKQEIAQKLPLPIQVKTEPEVDQMMYLNPYADNAGFLGSSDSNLISPNSQISGGDESRQSGLSTGNLNVGDIVTTDMINPANADLYNANFISNDMPTELFEDTSLLNDAAATGTADAYTVSAAKYGSNGNFDSRAPPVTAAMTTAGKMLDNGSFGASTSAAAAAVAAVPDANVASTSKAAAAAGTQQQGKNIDNNMAVAKYTGNSGPNGEILRTEVTDHLENVQDELESLKDLLRSENLSIDQNMLLGSQQQKQRQQLEAKRCYTVGGATFSNKNYFDNICGKLPEVEFETELLKLFNDSDIMDSYGLSFLNDNIADKNKGSELMAYQPMYDLSDMINDNKDAEADKINTSEQSGGARQLQTQNSVLNTPRHD